MTAVTVMSNAIPIGSLIASVIPSLTIRDNPLLSINDQKSSFDFFLIISNIVVTILAVPLVALARNTPLSPPS